MTKLSQNKVILICCLLYVDRCNGTDIFVPTSLRPLTTTTKAATTSTSTTTTTTEPPTTSEATTTTQTTTEVTPTTPVTTTIQVTTDLITDTTPERTTEQITTTDQITSIATTNTTNDSSDLTKILLSKDNSNKRIPSFIDAQDRFSNSTNIPGNPRSLHNTSDSKHVSDFSKSSSVDREIKLNTTRENIGISPSSSVHQIDIRPTVEGNVYYEEYQTATPVYDSIYSSAGQLMTSYVTQSEMYFQPSSNLVYAPTASDMIYQKGEKYLRRRSDIDLASSVVIEDSINILASLDHSNQQTNVPDHLESVFEEHASYFEPSATIAFASSMLKGHKDNISIHPTASYIDQASIGTTEAYETSTTNDIFNERTTTSDTYVNWVLNSNFTSNSSANKNQHFMRDNIPIIHISPQRERTKVPLESKNLLMLNHDIPTEHSSADSTTGSSGNPFINVSTSIQDNSVSNTTPDSVGNENNPILISRRPIVPIAITLFNIGRDLYSTCVKHSQCPDNSKCRPNACEGFICLCNEGYIASDDRKFCLKG